MQRIQDEEPPHLSVLRKRRYRVQTALVLATLPVGLFVGFQSMNHAITKDQGLFWFAVLLLPVLIFDILASIATGESYAKGVSIFEENAPLSFTISLGIDVCLLALCLVGAIIYW